MFKRLFHGAAALLLTSALAFAAYNVGFDGRIIPNGGAPVVSACGTGALSTGSTDTAGEVTMTGATGCTLTFSTAFATAPSCVVTEETINTAARTVTVSTASIVIAAAGSGSKVSWMCMAKAGG
jgi:hypothetical protein